MKPLKIVTILLMMTNSLIPNQACAASTPFDFGFIRAVLPTDCFPSDRFPSNRLPSEITLEQIGTQAAITPPTEDTGGGVAVGEMPVPDLLWWMIFCVIVYACYLWTALKSPKETNRSLAIKMRIHKSL